ncbi:MAG: hypothetical protein ACKVZH_29165 [Blastocatellia bacterium]
MSTKRLSRKSGNSLADTAGADPFAVFEIIADARKIQTQSANAESVDCARRIEKHADVMVKQVLGTADLSVTEVPATVIEQIVEMLRAYR